jgi:hypothetical protein
MAALAKAADTIDKTITRALDIVNVGTETAVNAANTVKNVANTTGETVEGVASTVKHAVGIADETTGAIKEVTAAMHSYSKRQAEVAKAKTEAVKKAQSKVIEANARKIAVNAETDAQIADQKGQTEVAKEERKTEVTRAKMLKAIENAKSKLEIDKKKAARDVRKAESDLKQEVAKRDIKDANIEFDVKIHSMEMQNKYTEEEHKLNNEREAADRKLRLANLLSQQLHEAELLMKNQENDTFVRRITFENEKKLKCLDIGYGKKPFFGYKKLDGELPKTFYIATHLKKDKSIIVKVTHKKNEHDVYAYYTEDGTMIDNLNDYTYRDGTTMQLLDLKPPSKGGKRKTRKPIRKTRRRKRSNTKKRRNSSHLLKL